MPIVETHRAERLWRHDPAFKHGCEFVDPSQQLRVGCQFFMRGVEPDVIFESDAHATAFQNSDGVGAKLRIANAS